MKQFLPRIKDFAADLSLANLCFLKAWTSVLYIDPENIGYFLSGSPIPVYLATIADIMLLALLFYTLRAIETKSSSKIISRIRLALTIFAIGLTIVGFRSALNLSGLLPHVSIIPAMLLFLTVSILMVKYHHPASRCLRLTSLVFLPLFFIIIVQAAIKAASWEPPPTRTASIEPGFKTMPHDNSTSPHIIWIIFDEMDERIAFVDRPPTLRLPELDRFRLESLSADHALPPSGLSLLSMPSLISGFFFEKARPASANDLFLKIAGQEDEVRWGSLPSIFSKLGEKGYTSQVAGYYHPYDRVFMGDLINAHSYPRDIFEDTRNRKMISNMLNVFGALFLAKKIRPQTVLYYRSMYNKLHDQAKSDIIKPVTLTLLHYPIPHQPYLYDRVSEAFSGSFRPQTHDRYLDNLALVDRTLGELRKKLESVGMWETSTIIISADHWWRFANHYDGKTDYRVPFMVKLAGQNIKITYSRPFNTILTGDMILSIVAGDISTHHDLSAWLDKNGRNIQPIVPEGFEDLWAQLKLYQLSAIQY